MTASLQRLSDPEWQAMNNHQTGYAFPHPNHCGKKSSSSLYKYGKHSPQINIDKDWNWISSHNDLGVEMRNLSDDYSLLAIQGPKAVEAMQSLTSLDLSAIKYYHFE